MTKNEILNHLNARGGNAVTNEIAAKVADMRGILSVQFKYENEDHTDGYIHKRIICLYKRPDEQIIAEAEFIADELEQIKARESYYATFTVKRIENDDNGKREKTIFNADYDHEMIPEWEQTYPKDEHDEDHEFCSFFN